MIAPRGRRGATQITHRAVGRAARTGCWLLAILILGSLHPLHAADGDLGRTPSSIFEGLLPRQLWLGPVRGYSYYPLTDDEVELRDRAYTLIRSNDPRNVWNAIVDTLRISQTLPASGFDRAAYSRTLVWSWRRSEASQYATLIDDARSDAMLIGPFVAIACRVADMDVKRERSLVYVHDLAPDERSNTLGRIIENRMIVDWVVRSLYDRAEQYRYALERLVIALPSPMAVEAERTVAGMQQLVHGVRPALARCAAGAVAVVPTAARRPGPITK